MHLEDRLRSHTPASGVSCSMHENLLSRGPYEPIGLEPPIPLKAKAS